MAISSPPVGSSSILPTELLILLFYGGRAKCRRLSKGNRFTTDGFVFTQRLIALPENGNVSVLSTGDGPERSARRGQVRG